MNAQARAEDIRFLAETGECLTGAARRLGLTNSGLEEWCKDNGLRREAFILRSREPRDHNSRGVVGWAS